MKPNRPETLTSFTTKVTAGYGSLYITISEYEGKPFEIFCTIGKSGQSIMAKAEVVGRLVSLALRYEFPLEDIVDQLLDISGEHPTPWKDELIKSIPDAVGKVLKRKYLQGETNGLQLHERNRESAEVLRRRSTSKTILCTRNRRD